MCLGNLWWTAAGSDWNKGRHQGMGRCRYAPAVLSPHRFAAVPPVHEPRAAMPSAAHTLMPTAFHTQIPSVEILDCYCLAPLCENP